MQAFKSKSIVLLQGVFDASLLAKLPLAKMVSVVIMEGRPSCEAAVSSSKVLLKRGINPTVISDNIAGQLLL